MKQTTITIMNESGIHARPATNLVKLAKKFDCDLQIKKNEQIMSLKSMISILALGIEKNDEIQLIANGDNEDIAIEEMVAFFQNGCGE